MVVSGTVEQPGDGGFAVGVFGAVGFQSALVATRWALVLVNVGAAVAIAIWPAVRRRRRTG